MSDRTGRVTGLPASRAGSRRQAARDRPPHPPRDQRDGSRFLVNVGLEYLTLSRASATLSGGESQRIRLASQIGSGLTGVLYVLDEPSIGLHQRDNDAACSPPSSGSGASATRSSSSSTTRGPFSEPTTSSTWAPGPGCTGARVVARGTPGRRSWPKTEKHHRPIPHGLSPDSGAGPAAAPGKARADALSASSGRAPTTSPTSTVDFPLGTCSPVHHRRIGRRQVDPRRSRLSTGRSPGGCTGRESIPASTTASRGIEFIDKVVDIDQVADRAYAALQPGHLHRRMFTPIRDWFSSLPEARVPAATSRGASPSTSRAGAARPARGTGSSRSRCTSSPTSTSSCDVCKGKRYNRETMEIRFRDKSHRRRARHDRRGGGWTSSRRCPPSGDKLETLKRVGLGYIHLGQQATTLSGGEAQRVKLAKELSPAGPRAGRSTISWMSRPRASTSRMCASCSTCSTRSSSQGNTVDRHRAQPRGDQDSRLDR